MRLVCGSPTGYGLGVSISNPAGRRRISHIYPGASGAPGQIAARVASIIFASTDTAGAGVDALARRIYDSLTQGTIDRSLFTPAGNAYFTPQVLADYQASLAPLGAPTEFSRRGETLRVGMTLRFYRNDLQTGRITCGDLASVAAA
ncbi:MAG: hypothetical protein ACT4O1_05905 [Gemmatimonadota bacterium]